MGQYRPEQKCAAEQQEYQSDIPEEMLIEGSGGRHTGDRQIPTFGQHKHQDAVRYHCDAEQHRYAETCCFPHGRSIHWGGGDGANDPVKPLPT